MTLTVDSLVKRFEKKSVLKDLSFSFQTPVLGISGSNGSGKSTLLRCLTGLLKPTSGSVLWSVDSFTYNPKQIKPLLGFSAPYVELYEELTISENLNFLFDLQNKTIHKGIKDHLTFFEAEDFINSQYGHLSTGQQQRVKLAAATINSPSILVLDEPGSNLDLAGKEIIKNLVKRFRDEEKMVLIASNLSEELSLCDKILDLNNQ